MQHIKRQNNLWDLHHKVYNKTKKIDNSIMCTLSPPPYFLIPWKTLKSNDRPWIHGWTFCIRAWYSYETKLNFFYQSLITHSQSQFSPNKTLLYLVSIWKINQTSFILHERCMTKTEKSITNYNTTLDIFISGDLFFYFSIFFQIFVFL